MDTRIRWSKKKADEWEAHIKEQIAFHINEVKSWKKVQRAFRKNRKEMGI